MGLNDSYMQIRSSILSREVLPDVRSAYAIISSEESHRVVVGSIVGSSQRNRASAFVFNVPNSQNFQRSNQNFSFGPSRPNNLNNNRQGEGSGFNNNKQGGGSGMVCENYGFNGRTIDRCFKIIGYPADSSSGFTDEQMATLISLIKDNKVRKNMQANMAGTNQHMTYTHKELDNVLDISHLKIKVGHPNGTEAYISKIGNIRLSNGLTLYDVIVIPEYCVTLIFVHKLVKENKVIVAFDENICYFLNQDLNMKNVLGIGEQQDWHCRLGHPAVTVLNGGIPLKMWTECILTAAYLINRLSSSVLNRKSPYEMTYKKCPTLSHLRVFDCLCFATIVNNNDKFSSSEYPEIPNDDERVANDLNKDKSDNSSSSMSGSNINTADFLVDSGNDADSSDGLVATQNEEVATVEENVFLG
ncbi:hypothetical protein Tco_0950795 [Tanacetum coccineum]